VTTLTPAHRDVPERRPSIRDVAVLAGVSYQTVSRVLNSSPRVRAQTRDRVLAAMTDLDYIPDIAARALGSGKRTTLGIIDLGRHRYGPSLIEDAIRRAATRAGVRTVVSAAESNDRLDLERALREVLAERAHSLIVIGDAALASTISRELVPDLDVVYTDRIGAGSPETLSPQYLAARTATEHLISLGHRVIGHISGPDASSAAERRRLGWQDALVDAGLSPHAIFAGSWSEDTGYLAATALLADDELTALFAANDAMAFGALHAAADLGRQVPQNVSIVGFDDVPSARHHTPSLTTMRQDFTSIGEAAFHQTHPSALTIDVRVPEIQVRASTGGVVDT